MLKLIRRDLILLIANWQINIFYFLLMLLMVFGRGIEGINEIIIISISIVGYFLTVMTFSYEIRIKPNLLIQSLPVSRIQVVVSRYLSTFIGFIIGLVYTLASLWIIQRFKTFNVDIFNFQVLKESFLLLLLVVSLTLPIFFTMRPKTASVLTSLIYLTALNSLVTAPKRVLGRLESLNYLSGIIVISYFISLGLSIYLYEEKDLN